MCCQDWLQIQAVNNFQQSFSFWFIASLFSEDLKNLFKTPYPPKCFHLKLNIYII